MPVRSCLVCMSGVTGRAETNRWNLPDTITFYYKQGIYNDHSNDWKTTYDILLIQSFDGRFA